MELQGKIIQALPLQTGEGRNGTWKKQEIVIETPGQYPKKVCIAIWGDRINESQLQTGNEITASVDVESREYNGRWYTEVKAWKIESKQEQPPFVDVPPPPPADDFMIPEAGDDLPF